MRFLLSAALLAALALPASADEPRDGSHDFDFNLGYWHTHIKRLTKPLSGSSDFVELDGTITVDKIFETGGSIDHLVADGPGRHFEGSTLFLYNPEAHQWSQTFVGRKDGVLQPPTVGSFKDGRGALYGQDTLNGRTILVRDEFFDILPDTHRFEESYSADGGKNWEVVFSAQLTRLKS